tara:strand:+ start:730 stop:975 length:246 start_codon:yes stop_codon:yes gene_type:complete
MNWETILIVLIVGSVLFMKQFGIDLLEKTKMWKRNQAKGDERWRWATTPPYFTFQKIIYWITVVIIVSITLYLGLKLEMMM